MSTPDSHLASNLVVQRHAAMATPVGVMALKLIIASRQAALVQSIKRGDGEMVQIAVTDDL